MEVWMILGVVGLAFLAGYLFSSRVDQNKLDDAYQQGAEDLFKELVKRQKEQDNGS